MSEPIGKTEYNIQLQSIFNMAALVRNLRIQEVLDAINRAETVAPVLDPTLYIRAAPNMEWIKETVEAALAFQAKVEAIANNPRYLKEGASD